MPLTISLLTMVNEDDTIINDTYFPLPTGLSHTSLDPLLLAETAELETLYPEPNTLKTVIKAWATVRGAAWEKMMAALNAQYNPISNYDRTEYWTDTHNLTNTRELHGAHSAASQSSGSGTDTGSVAGYNSTEWTNKDKLARSDTGSVQSQGANDSMETNRDTGTLTRAGSVSGNIGVTTNQQMIQAELELRQMDIYRIIINEFIKMFCLGVF